MKTGRNDPCPCGSGNKHKNCCLDKQNSTHSTADLALRRIRRELDGQPERMLRFVDQVYGPVGFDEAWAEFMLHDVATPAFHPASPFMPIFMPWMLHHWSPTPDDTEVADAEVHGLVPTRAFLNRKGQQLAPVMREYLESCLRRPFSFYEVERCIPGRSIALRDLLTGDHFEVFEQSASKVLKPNEVIFAQLASADGVTLLEATSPISLPTIDKVPIIDLRAQMLEEDVDGDANAAFVGSEMLESWAFDLRDLFLELASQYLTPTIAEMQTANAEDLQFHKLVYDIDSAQIAFDALVHLGAESIDLEFGVRHSADGALESVDMNWMENVDGEHAPRSVMGFFRINGTRLVAEVNSAERAQRLKAIIAESLGAHATFRADSVQTLEQAMDDKTVASIATNLDREHPAFQHAVTAYMHKHYQQWIDDRIPALRNRTPREMMASADGREQVAALVYGAEQHDVGLSPAAHKEVFDAVRKTLGLLP